MILGVILSSVSNSVRSVARERYRTTGSGTGAAVHLDMSQRVPSCQVSWIASHVCAACDMCRVCAHRPPRPLVRLLRTVVSTVQ